MPNMPSIFKSPFLVAFLMTLLTTGVNADCCSDWCKMGMTRDECMNICNTWDNDDFCAQTCGHSCLCAWEDNGQKCIEVGEAIAEVVSAAAGIGIAVFLLGMVLPIVACVVGIILCVWCCITRSQPTVIIQQVPAPATGAYAMGVPQQQPMGAYTQGAPYIQPHAPQGVPQQGVVLATAPPTQPIVPSVAAKEV
uniref:Uncharacterized protein n=1 Tax=Eutreptiella gymnastica TaxID=73025 RepID=A0A6U8NX88_9EUGL